MGNAGGGPTRARGRAIWNGKGGVKARYCSACGKMCRAEMGQKMHRAGAVARAGLLWFCK